MKSSRKHIDDARLPLGGRQTIWNHGVPIKIIVFMWNVLLDCLPIWINLSLLGVELESTLCPNYEVHQEESSHFLNCDLALQVWTCLAVWLGLDILAFNTVEEMTQWVNLRPVVGSQMAILDFVCSTLIWVLWIYRNAIIF